MAVDRANFIPICSYRKGKGLFSYENKPFYIPLVEISGIEPLTFPAVNAGKPPAAAMIKMQEVSGVRTAHFTKQKTEDFCPRLLFGGDKRDRTADLLNSIERLATFCSEKVREIANIKSF